MNIAYSKFKLLSYAALLVILLAVLFLAQIVIGWAGPTASAPNNNVAAPVNVGTTDQVKSGGLGLNSLAVFGNTVLAGTGGSYLNFGATAGASGYGIRDNAGTLEFKNTGGLWNSLATTIFNYLSLGPVTQIKFSDGTTQTTAASSTGGGTGGAGSSLSFYAYAASSQPIPQEMVTKIAFDSERFDTNNTFNVTTDRFKPTTAGKYILTAVVGTVEGEGSRILQTMIYKNGSVYSSGGGVAAGGSEPHYSTVTTIADANGTTDYFDVYVFSGYDDTTDAEADSVYFTGALLR